MSTLRIEHILGEPRAAGGRLSARLSAGGRSRDVFFEVRGLPVAAHADAFVAAALLPAMREHDVLEVGAPVSARLLAALPAMQDIFRLFDRGFHRVRIEADAVERPVRAGGAYAFFSGGVDSFYTLQKHEAALTGLLFAHGFDIPLEDTALHERAAGPIRAAAERVGKRLVEVATNVRSVLEDRAAPPRRGAWTMVQGAALASIGLALGGDASRVFIPATFSYDDLGPWGTHPLLDPLWSTESLAFLHDGCEATRLEKVERLAGWPAALSTLRVCYKNIGGAYNCGICNKCVRTMIELRMAGALDHCPVFAVPLDLRRLARMHSDYVDDLYLADCRRVLEERGTDPELRRALARVLDRKHLLERGARYLAGRARRLLGRQG